MSDWDDEKRAQAVKMYQEREPTPENSMDLVKEIAEELGVSPNGVRMILSKEGVYVKKSPSAASTTETKSGGTRVSKEEAHSRLTKAIEAKGGVADADIVSKLTGKAALYFAEILENRNTD
jgi:transposase-like protein